MARTRIDLPTQPTPGQVAGIFATGLPGPEHIATLTRGMVVDFGVVGRPAIGRAIIREIWFGEYPDVPARLVEQIYDPRARSFRDLLRAFKMLKGDFGEKEYVALVLLERTEATLR